MNKFFTKLPFICLIAVMCGLLTGCDPTKSGEFSVSVKEVGSSYVDLAFTGPEAVEVAYMIDTKEQLMNNPSVIFKSGVEMTVSGGDVVRITKGIDEQTQYYLYLVAKIDAQNYSEIFTLPFKTTAFDFDQLATVIDRDYDGYRMRLTLPESTKEAGNAIRWNQSCLMMYNYMRNNDYFSLLYNASHYTTEDVTIVYSEEENWYQTDIDSDGDGEPDWDIRYNPISPGEPIVFVAGEFAWMEDSSEYETENFKFPAGWEPGYYLPLINEEYYENNDEEQSNVGILDSDFLKHPLDDYWTGAFQRKHFRVQEPALLDGGVEVKLASVTPVNATLEFYPDDNVYQYALGVFDENLYKELLRLCNNNEDYLQWAVTSYFGAYTFGTKVAQGAAQVDLTTFYYQSAISPEKKYKVIVTAMGDAAGTVQSFSTFDFETTKRTLPAPVIQVEVVEDETTPYIAAFNIKCTTYENNPVTEAYYAANYLRDWLLAINAGSTYFGITSTNVPFSADELEKINSAEGYTIKIPSVDGETTRLVVAGYNAEYLANQIDSYEFIEDCPAVADCTTPYVKAKPYVDETLYSDLAGVWTASATLSSPDGKKTHDWSSKITIAADLYDYPSSLSEEIYKLYEDQEFTRDEIDAMWYEFKQLAKEITEERLQNQNRLVGIGWLDEDSYDRLEARTPYDLFIAKDYVSVDVSSLYNDYGPKWYIETRKNEDGKVEHFIPIDSNFLPPASNWSIPFYLGAMQKGTWYTITSGDGWTPEFPVVVSEDRNTITIKPLIYVNSDGEELSLYPNMIGIDPTYGTILENPVVSEVVLERGWSGSDNEQSVVRKSSESVKAEGNFPTSVYKQRTRLTAPVELNKIEMPLMTVEKFHENARKLIESKYSNQNN